MHSGQTARCRKGGQHNPQNGPNETPQPPTHETHPRLLSHPSAVRGGHGVRTPPPPQQGVPFRGVNEFGCAPKMESSQAADQRCQSGWWPGQGLGTNSRQPPGVQAPTPPIGGCCAVHVPWRCACCRDPRKGRSVPGLPSRGAARFGPSAEGVTWEAGPNARCLMGQARDRDGRGCESGPAWRGITVLVVGGIGVGGSSGQVGRGGGRNRVDKHAWGHRVHRGVGEARPTAYLVLTCCLELL